MRLTIESSFDSRILRNSSDMQLKKSSITESPVEVLLQGRLINDEGIVLEDGEIGSLFQKLCIDDQQEEEPTNLSGCPQKFDDSEENYDESLLNPKGPVKNKPPREQPYEQRLFNKSLMNGGGMVQNFCYYPQIPLHGMIPIPVQKFQSQSASKNIALEEPGYHPYSQYMGPLERMNIPLVTNNDWNGTYQPLQITSNRVDSPLSSDSGINSPSSSPNGRHNQQAWSYDQPPMLGLGVATQVPMSEVQADSPCSPDSGHSPKGSPDSSWLNNSMSPNHGYYSNSPSTLNLSSPKVPNTPLNWDQNLYRGSVDYSMGTINVPEHNWSMPPESFTQFSHHPTNYKGDGGCTTGFPDANLDLGQMDPMQWRDLEKFVREVLDSPQDAIGEAASAAPAVEQESSAARPFTQVPPPETFAPDTTPTPTPDEPKPKSKGRSKTKARQEKAPQQKRKPSKTISLGTDRPKICDMIDSKKESTKAIWMGISLMPEETFCRKNKIGQTCLMEVLQGDKLSIERAFYIVQRMKKDGKLLSAKDESGKNALYLAALRPHIPLAEFIAASYASAGLDVNEPFFAEENSLIHCLVEEGDSHAEVLREMLDVKVDNGRLFDSNATNINGDTPLHLALRNLSKKSPPFDLTAVDTLLKRGASISIKNSEGDTPLHLAAKVACEEKVFQKLFERLSLPPEENPCAMNIQDNNGNTPLHLVAYQINPCNVEKMKKVINVFLSEKNTRTDVENNRNTTPEGNIHQSCAKDCFELFHKRRL